MTPRRSLGLSIGLARRPGRAPDIRPTPRALALALAVSLALAAALAPPAARAADPGESAAAPTAVSRRPFPSRDEVANGTRRGTGRDDAVASTGSWWLGTAGIAAALAACGWLSLAARRWTPTGVAGAAGLRVVGRTNLSPRHAVYLLQAGDRVLLVGTGPQGPPSLLGELPAGAPIEAEPVPESVAAAGRRFDLRLGDDT